MKKYPPRKHDKSKRIKKTDWPRFVLHCSNVSLPTKVRVPKGLIARII